MPTKQWISQGWLLICVGGVFIVLLELGIQYQVPQRFLIPPLMALGLIFASMAVWIRANTLASRAKKKHGQDHIGL